MWALVWWGCASGTPAADADTALWSTGEPRAGAPRADVVGVSVTGDPGAWVLAVTIRSDELGCARYADWWEVIDPGGALRHRRLLDHAHPDEQPFTRSSETPVAVLPDELLIVRAHLADEGGPGGYGQTMEGTAVGGFQAVPRGATVAPELADAPPQPVECLF